MIRISIVLLFKEVTHPLSAVFGRMDLLDLFTIKVFINHVKSAEWSLKLVEV